MAKSDGYLKKITKHQRTKILPLRWIGNLCGDIAGNSVVVCVEDPEDNPFTTVTLNGISDHMPFTKETLVSEINMPNSDILIETILAFEQLKECKLHSEKKTMVIRTCCFFLYVYTRLPISSVQYNDS